METVTPTWYEEAQSRNRTLLLQALQAHGVTQAIVTYSGGGDSGDHPDADAYPAGVIQQLRTAQVTQLDVRPDFDLDGGRTKQLVEVSKPIDQALCDFALDWADMHHAGWYNDDGGTGTLTVDVAEEMFALAHVTYFTESQRHEYFL